MTLDKNLLDRFVDITSLAAIATYNYIGKKNKDLADKAAVDVMRSEINKLNINGRIVIGEGELDEAPMLYIGEKLGTGKGIALDIAVDPLEGTNFVANNLPGGLSVLAISKKNNLFAAPETYMDKIAVGSDIPQDAVDLDNPLEINLKNIADSRNKNLTDLRVCLLDRPRHKKIIEKLKYLKVKTKLITDGDVSGSLLVTDKKHDVDLFLGIGGGPEGVLSACALDTFNCKFQGRFIFKSDQDIKRAKEMGINDLEKKYEINEIIKGDSIFCATGITSGDILNGIKIEKENFITETLVTHKSKKLIKIYKKKYKNQ